jgi:hypothetical protein
MDDSKSRASHIEFVSRGNTSRKVNLPPTVLLSEAWLGTYKENGATGHTYYTIRFNQIDEDLDQIGTFEGKGYDCDGSFEIRNAVYSAKTGCLAWAEHSKTTSLIASCEVKCVDEKCIEMYGRYIASTGVGGRLKLRRQLPSEKKMIRVEDVVVKDTEKVVEAEESVKETEEDTKEKMKQEDDQGWGSYIWGGGDISPTSTTTTPVEEEPDVWVRAYDSESGQHYYWNRRTKQTSWSDPTA